MNTLFLNNERKSKRIFKNYIKKVAKVLTSSYKNKKCYSGSYPNNVKEDIKSINFINEDGVGFDKALSFIEEKFMPHAVFTSSPFYMPHLHSPVLIESFASEMIISALNQSMDSWDQGPSATETECAVIKQLCSLYNLKDGDGAFTSGGSQSNLTALFLARDNKLKSLGFDAINNPLGDYSKKLVCYTSEISHFSFDKAAHLLGIGYSNVRKIKTDEKFRIDINDLKNKIEDDIKKGLIPFCTVATAGSTDYGSIDPIIQISDLCKKYNIYFHIDAAYGGALILSDKYKNRIDGVNLADSITVDFHKMFLLPISCSAILVKSSDYLAPLSFRADYLNREEDELNGYTNLVSKGIQCTRRFDALKVMFSFLVRGTKEYGEIVTTCIDNAKYFYNQLKNRSETFEVLNNPEISAILFRSLKTESSKIRNYFMHNKGIFLGESKYKGIDYLKVTLLNPNCTKETIDYIISEIEKV